MLAMRGNHRKPNSLFSYVSPEWRTPKDHPLRASRALVDDVLVDMSREFDRLYRHLRAYIYAFFSELLERKRSGSPDPLRRKIGS
jgi:hypothetical protein